MLEKVKLALRISTTAYDADLTDLISAAIADLQIAGVSNTDTSDPIIGRAVITYVKLHFGEAEDADRLKKSYDEQKAQLSMATGYTDWEV